MNTSGAYHYLNLGLGIYLGFVMSVVTVISVVKTNSVNVLLKRAQIERDFGIESKFVDSICAEDLTRVEEIMSWKGTNARDAPKQKLTDVMYRVITRPVQGRDCVCSTLGKC